MLHSPPISYTLHVMQLLPNVMLPSGLCK